ncbi:MAG: hypothetical protein KY445_16715, partial [Armatimonadetes bacterium]|nr:hypothetical protein [Armatimonadota bacterium]
MAPTIFAGNPVLLRELRAGLRNARAFALMALYVAILGAIVTVSFPANEQIDLRSDGGAKGRDLFEALVWGQILLVLAL